MRRPDTGTRARPARCSGATGNGTTCRSLPSWKKIGSPTSQPTDPSSRHAHRPTELLDAHGDDHASAVHDRHGVADHLDLEPDVPDRGPDPPAQRARRQPQPRQVGPGFPGRAARAYRRSARSPGQAERSHSPGLDAALPGPGPVRGNEPHDGDPCPDRQRRTGDAHGTGDRGSDLATAGQRAVDPRGTCRAWGQPTGDRFLQGAAAAAYGRRLGECSARADENQTPTFLLPPRSARLRRSSVSTFLRSRILLGVISTSSSDSMYSRAISSVSSRGGLSKMFLSDPDARMLVNFFSLQGLTTMSSLRAFSPMIMPS